MKDLVSKFLGNIHWFILVYNLYGVYVKWEEHTVQMDSIESQYAGIEQDTKIAKKSLEEIEENKSKINEFKLRVEEVAKNIEAVQKQLPPEINEIQITTFMNKEMETLNIKDTQITPGGEVTSTYYVSKDFNLKGYGTYLQFLIFFERISNAARIYNIKSLNLKTRTDARKGRFQLVDANFVIQAFRYNPDFKVDLGFDKVELPTEGAAATGSGGEAE